MLLVAVSGGIGSGKSTLSRLLGERGATVVEADELALQALAPATAGERAVLTAFGQSVADSDGHIDRARLGALVFSDDHALEVLESIVHPIVRQAFMDRVAAAPEDAVVVYDVPLLAESGDTADFDLVVMVESSRDVRLERLASRGLTRADALARMAHQATDERRREIADVVISNEGSEDDLRREVENLWTRLDGMRGEPTV